MVRAPRSRIGLISDTHGLLRPAALDFLQGCDAIVHSGDIGNAQILEDLARIAPLVAIRGNNDLDWAVSLNDTEFMDVQNIRLYVIHDANDLRPDVRVQDVHIIVSGHSHRPSLREKAGVFYINPGSAGPRRFTLPVAIGELLIQGGAVSARLVNLTSGQAIASQEYLRADLLDRHSI